MTLTLTLIMTLTLALIMTLTLALIMTLTLTLIMTLTLIGHIVVQRELEEHGDHFISLGELA